MSSFFHRCMAKEEFLDLVERVAQSARESAVELFLTENSVREAKQLRNYANRLSYELEKFIKIKDEYSSQEHYKQWKRLGKALDVILQYEAQHNLSPDPKLNQPQVPTNQAPTSKTNKIYRIKRSQNTPYRQSTPSVNYDRKPSDVRQKQREVVAQVVNSLSAGKEYHTRILVEDVNEALDVEGIEPITQKSLGKFFQYHQDEWGVERTDFVGFWKKN